VGEFSIDAYVEANYKLWLCVSQFNMMAQSLFGDFSLECRLVLDSAGAACAECCEGFVDFAARRGIVNA
jgi:hypothetical protein